MKCKEFRELLNGYGIGADEINKAIESLKAIYLSGSEILTDIGPGEEIFSIPPILEQKSFQLFVDETHGYGKLPHKHYFSILTENGIELAKDCLQEKIECDEEDIENIVKNYSKKFLYVLLHGTYQPSKAPRFFQLELPNYEAEIMNPSEDLERYVSSQISSFIVTGDSDLLEDYWQIRNSNGGVLGHISSKQRENIGKIPLNLWDVAFSKLLLGNNASIREAALQFFEEMEEIGFAKISDSHNYNEYTGKVYRMPEEMLQFINPVILRPTDEFKILGAFWLISLAKRGEYSKKEFFEYASKLDIKEDDIPLYIEALNVEFPGLTTPYNPNSGDFMPFIVRGDVDDSLKVWLDRVATTILADSGDGRNAL